MTSYTLPITALLETMGAVGEAIYLHAQLPSLPQISKENCVAEVVLDQGIMHFCAIKTTAGHVVLTQKDAFSLLSQVGDLEWDIVFLQQEVITSPTTQSAAPQRGVGNIPRRTNSTLPPARMSSLPHRHRRVLALVDGRSVEEIARLLSISPDMVEKILLELEQTGFIQ